MLLGFATVSEKVMKPVGVNDFLLTNHGEMSSFDRKIE